MRKRWLLVIFGILVTGVAVRCLGQDAAKNMDTSTGKKVCECGAHPPGPPRDRTVTPYAGTPDDLKPFGKFTPSYDVNYIRPNIYMGAARKIPDPADITEVRIEMCIRDRGRLVTPNTYIARKLKSQITSNRPSLANLSLAASHCQVFFS